MQNRDIGAQMRAHALIGAGLSGERRGRFDRTERAASRPARTHRRAPEGGRAPGIRPFAILAKPIPAPTRHVTDHRREAPDGATTTVRRGDRARQRKGRVRKSLQPRSAPAGRVHYRAEGTHSKCSRRSTHSVMLPRSIGRSHLSRILFVSRVSDSGRRTRQHFCAFPRG